MAGTFSDVGRSGRTWSSNFICSVLLEAQPNALAGCVESGILQKTSTRFSSIVSQDYDYTPVRIR